MSHSSTRSASSTTFLILNAVSRGLSGLFSDLKTFFTYVFIIVWDLGLTIVNLVSPAKPKGQVVPEGCRGRGGLWPEYQPAVLDKGFSRCSCPALNALANHGLLPRDGRKISFKQLNTVVRQTYNFGPTFCYFVPWFAANMIGRDYNTDKFDLSDLDVHNGIEHDASLTRDDTRNAPDQSAPSPELVEFLLSHASGPPTPDHPGVPTLTAADLSEVSGKRRVNARAKNGQFTLSTFHKMFGSSNSSTLLAIFGGCVPDLRIFLLEERLPAGWETKCRNRLGLTFTEFNKTVIQIEAGIHEEHDVMMWRVGKMPDALGEKWEKWMDGQDGGETGGGENLSDDSGIYVDDKKDV